MAKWKVSGFRDMDAALASLPKATRRNVAIRVLKGAAQPMADDMEERAPERTGKLKRTVKVSTRLSKGERKKTAASKSGVNVYIGPGPLKRARLQELGTEHSAPQAFVRPAWDAGKKKAVADIADSVAIEIRKALGRRARKINRATRKRSQ
nr:HK97-gp10 family putative phage morphogenesis protein [Sphingomonas sp. Y57]